MPLANLIRDTAHAVVETLGLEQKDAVAEGLATRCQCGTLVMQPAERSLQSKEIPLANLKLNIKMAAPIHDPRNDLRFAHHIQHPF